MDSQVDVSVIIPFFNEEEGIAELIAKIEEYYQIREFDFEIIFIDDGSTDLTSSKIQHQEFMFPCKLILLSKNFGPHSAVRAGILHSSNKFITCLPADLQISFDSLNKMYFGMMENNDIVFAIRESNENSFIENFFSNIHSHLMRKYVVSDFPIGGLETFMINEKVQQVLNANIEPNSSLHLQIFTLGFRKKIITIEKKIRKSGISKWTTLKKIKLLIDTFVSFSFFPIRFVTLIGVTLFLCGTFFTLFLVFRKLFYDDLVSGWTMLISILTMGFGITNISLGIIAEYLWRTFDSTRKRPVFIIDDIIELNK